MGELSGWVTAVATAFGVIVIIVGALWRFSKSVDRMNILVDQISHTIQAQWKRIDEHGEKIDEHEKMIAKLEAWKEYHDEYHKE